MRDRYANFRNRSIVHVNALRAAKRDDQVIRDRLLFHATRAEECGHLNAARYMRLGAETIQALTDRIVELERSRSYEGWR